VRRLGSRDQDITATVREMHTLKGAAITVACPRLAAMGLAHETAARAGRRPDARDVQAILEALEAFLAAVRRRAAPEADSCYRIRPVNGLDGSAPIRRGMRPAR
jgi:HPt (histidine-containing phosphotransfer) domain-containing protein